VGGRADVVGAALIGSHARGDVRADSDVDLMIVTEAPHLYLDDHAWVGAFGPVESVTLERWGAVTSLRVRYEGGPAAEMGITTPEWTSTEPLDPGTERVARDGMRIVVDRDGLLGRLVASLERLPRRQ
jgi:hypothetical protein